MEVNTIRVVITDDHPAFRASLGAALKADPQIAVVGEAENGSVAVAMVKQFRPDIVLMDIDMPEMTGIEATGIITAKFPRTKVIILTVHADTEYSRYTSLFENNHAVMLLIEPETAAIKDANPAACAYYGWSREEFRKLRIGDINTLSRDEIFAHHRPTNGRVASLAKANWFLPKWACLHRLRFAVVPVSARDPGNYRSDRQLASK